MLTINLKAQDEYQWRGENPSSSTFPEDKGWYPLYHQWRTYNAEKPIIVNTYNTGTGKTKAALLRLLKRLVWKPEEQSRRMSRRRRTGSPSHKPVLWPMLIRREDPCSCPGHG